MASDQASGPPPVISFHYIKSNYFRIVAVDGAYGGISPQGNFNIAVYNERRPIPRLGQRRALTTEGDITTYGEEEIVDSKEGLIREVEVQLNFDFRTAKEIYNWLGEKIKEYEKITLAKGRGEAKE